MSAEISAIREFLNLLPDEMIELALEAVHIKDELEVVTDLQTQIELQNELDLVNEKIIRSARPDRSMWN
jgi:hypothetical protein